MGSRSSDRAWEIMEELGRKPIKSEITIAKASVYAQLAIAEAIEQLAHEIKYKVIDKGESW